KVERIALANTIAAEMKKYFPHDANSIVLDYGCGTGLDGLELKDDCKKLIFSDVYGETLTVVAEQLEAYKIRNAESKQTEELGSEEADVIIVSLVMLHVPEFRELIKKLYDILNESGQLIIADFDKNDSVYHEKVHNGFTHDEMRFALAD